jgi:hypothetical protein
MDKVTWGVSQAITSALYFLLQLAFLKSNDLQVMALFSTLFGLMNFFLLAIRRSLIEVNLFHANVPSVSIVIVFSCGFFLFCLPISLIIQSDLLLVFCVGLFLFDQLVLDFVRFSETKNHYLYIGAQVVSVVLSVFMMLAGRSATDIILYVALLQFIFCILCIAKDKRLILGLHTSMQLVSVTRIIDFTVSSGFGFLMPVVTYLLLDANSVGELRTSQSFLSLGSVFASAFYYSALQEKSTKETPKITYLIPVLVLLGLLGSLVTFAPPSILMQIFGPYFYESLPLTWLLTVALVPTLWVSRNNAVLVKSKNFGSLLKIHYVTLLVLASGSSLGFLFFGLSSFGIFTIICAILELILTRRVIRTHNELQ